MLIEIPANLYMCGVWNISTCGYFDLQNHLANLFPPRAWKTYCSL